MMKIHAQQQQYTSKQNAVNHIETGRTHNSPVVNNKNVQVSFFSEDFEGGDLGNQTTISQDGDTQNWNVVSASAHSGTYHTTSAYWNQSPLTPDNWLITPAIDLSGATDTIFLEWYVAAQDQSWPSEVYRVLDSTSGTNDCTAVDAQLVSINIPSYTLPNTDVDIAGTVKNIGTSNITSFDVNYTVNGTSAGIYSVTGINLATGDNYDFVHNIPFNESVESIYTIEVIISNVNGGNDGNLSNNSLSSDINVTSNLATRTVLVEEFTTEECGSCPPVLQYLENIIDNDSNVIMMAHHSGFFTDFLTTQEADDMTVFYNDGGSTFTPAGMIDRAYDPDPYGDGTPVPGPVFWDRDPYGGNRINARKNTPAFVTVNICGAYDQTTRELNVRIEGEFMDNFSNMGVSLWVTEDHIAEQNQTGASSGFEHRFVERGVISSLLGDPITTSTNTGDTYQVEYTSYTMASYWNYDNLYLVAFVSKINDNDVNDREIANAVQIKLSDLIDCSTGINKLINDKIKVYPNPSTGNFTFSNVNNMSVNIYNMQGIEVYNNDNLNHILQINLSHLPNGTYFAKFTDNDKVGVKRIIIAK